MELSICIKFSEPFLLFQAFSEKHAPEFSRLEGKFDLVVRKKSSPET